MNKIFNNGDNVEKKSLNWLCVLVFEMNNMCLKNVVMNNCLIIYR